MAESRCACPRYVTRRECIRIRYHGHLVALAAYDDCECRCHDEQDALDAEYDALAASVPLTPNRSEEP
jgi:hypothetical protein